MTEKAYQQKVVNYLKSIPNTWFFKVWGGGFQRSGIPDLICCINGRFVAIELKGDSGKPTALQEMNIKKINDIGGIGLILYPDGFENLVKEVKNCNIPTVELNASRRAGFNLD